MTIPEQQDDIFTIHTVSWQVHNGAKWEPASMTPTKSKGEAEAFAERIRERAHIRRVTITEQRVREVTTAFLPYWVPVGEAA